MYFSVGDNSNYVIASHGQRCCFGPCSVRWIINVVVGHRNVIQPASTNHMYFLSERDSTHRPEGGIQLRRTSPAVLERIILEENFGCSTMLTLRKSTHHVDFII